MSNYITPTELNEIKNIASRVQELCDYLKGREVGLDLFGDKEGGAVRHSLFDSNGEVLCYLGLDNEYQNVVIYTQEKD